MNPFSGITWLWRALRLNSVTFGALFSLGILGLSVTRVLQNALGALGVPFLGLLILPFLLIGLLAKKEREWMPEESDRKKWARRLVFSSIAICVLLAIVSPKPDPQPSTPGSGTEREGPVRLRGPHGK